MCLAIPGKVIKIEGDTAIIDYGGIKKQAKIPIVKPKVGDTVLVHAGFAIEILKENKKKEDS
ncbi:MAG: HypC/HybG/HupF family hydrogenase formation chaperone [Candidatus Aenigmarchaeota archaeon]|nr:HypC/HybG/HupF family hydrogenase formation chaperone [Candidatus Aenigmarchaeota archaeon]